MDHLSKRLRAARSDVRPARDLWPGIESRVRTPRTTPWLRAAVVALAFGGGVIAGVWAERATVAAPSSTGPQATGPQATDPLEAAAAVQRAGSDYLAAIARFRQVTEGHAAERAQGYETAMGVVAVTVEELSGALGPADDALLELTRDARATVSRRATSLVEDRLRTNGGDE